MPSFWRGVLAFLIGSAGVALAFFGALEEWHGKALLALGGLLLGTLLVASFRVAPNDV